MRLATYTNRSPSVFLALNHPSCGHALKLPLRPVSNHDCESPEVPRRGVASVLPMSLHGFELEDRTRPSVAAF
jgi:hypothetical protein